MELQGFFLSLCSFFKKSANATTFNGNLYLCLFNEYNAMKKRLIWKRFLIYIPFILAILALCCCKRATTDVGNYNRYNTGGGGGGDVGDIGYILYYIMGLLTENPMLGLIIIAFLVLMLYMMKRKTKDTTYVNQTVNQQANNDIVTDYTAYVANNIREIDPEFSSDKFIGFAREVFMKIQDAWTKRDWKIIRPFESEDLFAQHKAQLEDYIRNNRINVVEKITIKHCSLHSFQQDGDKEVLTVWLNAIMRDYVVDAETKKVLESDPNRDWYMKYEMVFNRKAGLKTQAGDSEIKITNCPNCGAPTEITSAGQCVYCGSVITTGEHDWVLTDIHSRK